MSSEHGSDPISDEQIFLSRLADVSPLAESVEQMHVAAAAAAVREAGVTAEPSRRSVLRPTTPLWRKPRMALSKIAAIVAGLSLPAKAFAATAVAAATIGGGVAVTSAPPEDPPADTPAADALENAEENTGFELPARGEPEREGEPEATVEDDELEGQGEHGIDGPTQAEAAKSKDDGREFGETTADTASDGKSTEARAAAEEAQARQDAAAERRAEAQARADAEARAAAEERRAQARNNATTSTEDDEVETEESGEDVEGDDTSATGTERSGEGRARAGSASGR